MDFDKQIEGAIRHGRRVQEAVRAITLKALTGRELDLAAIRSVTREALEAIRKAAATENGGIGEAGKQAIRGVEHALGHAAQAIRLSLEEAAGRTEKFSKEDLAKARADLADVEKMFVDSLAAAARAARGTAQQTFEEMAHHAEASGTAIGRQLHESAAFSAQIAHAARAQFGAGLDAATTTGALFARGAAGVLAGIADALEGKRPT
jgi:hypothetical protein